MPVSSTWPSDPGAKGPLAMMGMPLPLISLPSSISRALAIADRAVWLSNGGLVAFVIRNDTSASSADSARFTCWASSSARISSIVSAVDV
jgi:hypothetical protein